ncbi:MAG: hypothetical protein U9O55_03585 [Patescibacteria group bacterium]|nr:hypothetical protein [Patescibacteria group bacterium]
MAQNIFLLFLKYITVDLIGDFFYFPVWWYTKGFKKAIFFSIKKIKDTEKGLGIGIWAKNLFKPMYAQYDWQGRIISFLMRLFQLIVRSIAFGVFFIIILFLPLIWLTLPIFIIFQIILIIKI